MRRRQICTGRLFCIHEGCCLVPLFSYASLRARCFSKFLLLQVLHQAFLSILQIAQAVGVDNQHSVRNMFPNREQFGRPIGPMGFAISASHNPPLPPPPPPIFALPAQHPIHQSQPPPSHTASAIRGRMDTNTPTTGQFLLTQLSTFTTVHRVTDIGISPLSTHSGHIHPASTQLTHDTEPDDNTPKPGIP